MVHIGALGLTMDNHVGPVRGVLRHLAVGLAGQVEVFIRLDIYVSQVEIVVGLGLDLVDVPVASQPKYPLKHSKTIHLIGYSNILNELFAIFKAFFPIKSKNNFATASLFVH